MEKERIGAELVKELGWRELVSLGNVNKIKIIINKLQDGLMDRYNN